MPPDDPPVLVIGIGNRDRGDDAVGPLVVDAVEEALGPAGSPRLATLVVERDLSDLSLRWQPDQHVVVVDAMVSGRPPGSVVTFDGLAEGPQPATPVSSHGVGLEAAITLGRHLDRLPRALTVVAVEGERFELFAPPGPDVRAAIERVASGLLVGDPGPWPLPSSCGGLGQWTM